ncbi:uncharacterized protein Z519_06026 [Cladophialophora bantiana CBS 173.52]|uniref:Uncharacterized protein n=1 Tax=Cladophialophora bantiana (strain ATCC 10958 / CBS 173.52 / CDC B-1940 / NIH 8579) TaxID=1442370 RepID=A0A0D2EU78_CLAB1|nr:uncharacterized protein Z519_06026 [Cladophialophora bantiana CBS 173.52]KIW93421.1 hypothetical protein Z519_06026 [Cladophialophora bantiana CBS 173.52]
MGKKSNRLLGFTTPPSLPMHPWIYVNDPTTSTPHVSSLKGIIGDCSILHHSNDGDDNFEAREKLAATLDTLKDDAFGAGQNVMLITENLADSKTTDKLEAATKIREQAIKGGRNFASVNLYLQDGTKENDKAKWGPNHLELGITNMTVKEVAQKIYSWLFTVFSPTEHVHLIPIAKLQAVDKQHFADYEYCAIADTKSYSKDAKIQFVAVIVTKPVVIPNTQRLQWTVADKSGLGNFYFQYRGDTSQYTWDWVLALRPGDIKALPRMPMVQVKESRRVRIAKFPLRAAGSAISGVGLALKTVGHGVAKLGDITSMGKSSEWVPSGDVVVAKDGKMKKIDWSAKFEKESKDRTAKLKAAMKKETPPKEKHSGTESDTSTLRWSEYENEKAIISEKEFC